MWDTGNEAGLGAAHYAMAEHAHATDPTRPLYHQSNSPDGDAPFADVWGPRYPSPKHLREIAERTTKPVVMGEWLHAMGNSLGHYEDMWRTIREDPSLQGGFVWDWVDQGLVRPLRIAPDSSGNDVPVHYGGDPKPVPGVSGQAVELSGLDDWAEAYRDPALEITGKAVTLDVQVKPLSWQGSGTYLSKGDKQWALQMPDAGHVEFFVYGEDSWHTARVEVPDDWWGKWHRLTGVYDGSQVRLLIDGEEVAAQPYSGEIASNTMYTVSVGRNQEKHADSFAGRTAHAVVDSARIYDRALSDAELAADPAREAALALNFDEERQQGTFHDYGSSNFLANGLINADRTPQPELAQLAYSHAPVRFEDAGAPGRFTVRNLNHTLSTAAYDLSWRLVEAGEELASGTLDVEVPAGGAEQVRLDLPQAGKTERFLELRARQRADAPSLPAGHVVSAEQLPAGGTDPAPAPVEGSTPGRVSVDGATVSGPDFRYEFDERTGALSSMDSGGVQRLVAGPELDVFRRRRATSGATGAASNRRRSSARPGWTAWSRRSSASTPPRCRTAGRGSPSTPVRPRRTCPVRGSAAAGPTPWTGPGRSPWTTRWRRSGRSRGPCRGCRGPGSRCGCRSRSPTSTGTGAVPASPTRTGSTRSPWGAGRRRWTSSGSTSCRRRTTA